MEILFEFTICLMAVKLGYWWLTRGRRAADAEQQAETKRLKDLGVKFD